MKTITPLSGLVMLMLVTSLSFLNSCKKEDPSVTPVYLTVDLPKLALKNDLYYSLDYYDRTIELEFSEPLDSATVRDNFSFSDKSGSLNSIYDLIVLDRKILMLFHEGYQLKYGWRYLITLGTGLASESGKKFASSTIIELRTCAMKFGTNGQRNAILCISDIHMGEERAVTGKYCWFSENKNALDSLLTYALNSSEIRQVVILGDLFDAWIIPYNSSPFAGDVHNINDYFHSVARSPVDSAIIAKFRAIASSRDSALIYVPGNHDMLLTRAVLEDIIPGVIWTGDIPGMGRYNPVPEITMEHGHRLDLFNGPQPLVKKGHMLPPGFFVSRMQAAGLQHQFSPLKSVSETTSSTEFRLAWDLTLLDLELKYKILVDHYAHNIIMDGIDGYAGPFSYHEAKMMYADSIETVWPATQTGNGVPVPMPVLMGIIDAKNDMFLAATYEYLEPQTYKMVVLGHTHEAEIKVYPAGKNHTGVYANTGSWVNHYLGKNDVRTYLMVWPAAWTGSDLDVVAEYQYNLANNGGGRYQPVLKAEESVGVK